MEVLSLVRARLEAGDEKRENLLIGIENGARQVPAS